MRAQQVFDAFYLIETLLSSGFVPQSNLDHHVIYIRLTH